MTAPGTGVAPGRSLGRGTQRGLTNSMTSPVTQAHSHPCHFAHEPAECSLPAPSSESLVGCRLPHPCTRGSRKGARGLKRDQNWRFISPSPSHVGRGTLGNGLGLQAPSWLFSSEGSELPRPRPQCLDWGHLVSASLGGCLKPSPSSWPVRRCGPSPPSVAGLAEATPCPSVGEVLHHPLSPQSLPSLPPPLFPSETQQ